MKRLFYSFAIILSGICLISCESEDALEPDYKNPSDYFQPAADDNSEEAQLRRKFFADHGSYLLFNDTLQNVYLGKDINGEDRRAMVLRSRHTHLLIFPISSKNSP